MTHGYAVQQKCSVIEGDDFYHGLGALFDRGQREEIHILTIDTSAAIGIDEDRTADSVCGEYC